MEGSSDHWHSKALAAGISQLPARRGRSYRVDFPGAWQRELLSGGSSAASASERCDRGVQGFGLRHCRTSASWIASDHKFRGGAALCHRLGATEHPRSASEPEEEKLPKQLDVSFESKRSRRKPGGSAEKRMARAGYQRRKDRKAQRGKPSWAQKVKEVCPDRERQEEEGKGEFARSFASFSSPCCSSVWRPNSELAGPAAGPGAEAGESGRPSPSPQVRRQQKHKPLIKQQRFQQWLERRSETSKRPLKSRLQLSQVGQKNVRSTPSSCEEVCAGHPGRAGGGGQTIQDHRLHEEDQLGQAKESTALPPPGSTDLGVSLEGGVRKGGVAVCSHAAGHSSGQPRQWRVASGLAADPHRGPIPEKAVRGRSELLAARDFVPAVHERAGEDHGESEEERVRKGESRGAGESHSKRKRKRKAQRQGEGQELNRSLSPPARPDQPAAKGSLHAFPIAQGFEDSLGSFGRFWKLAKSSCLNLNERLGPMTPPKQTKGDSIFPSLLVLPHNTGKSKSARRRARRRGRDMAWSYCEMLWAYFTFLDGGSPYKRIDQQRLLAKARSSTWTSLHAAYAGFLHDEIHRYTCLRCDDEPLSRGILKLSELVKVVRNSTYSGNTDIDKLSRVAKSVKPSRMSLPAAAGIIDPSKFLKGSHLEAFENMSTQVPHGVEPPNPTMGCYKVAPEDISEVNHRLLSSGVATLIPESMGMRNSKGEIITGGLFAVDHKPQSDRIILDRRPFNELERRLVWAKLPHESLLTQLIVPKGYSVRGSGDDLSNYFYLLKHRNDWLPRNAIGKPFDGEGYETYGGEKGKKYLLAFKVIAMGDLNAVDLAQQVHLEVLKDCSCMNEGECIEFKEPLPAAHTMEGLYIDDHIITQILPSKKNRKKGYKYRDEVLIERSREQYAKHGIPTSQNKSFDKAEKFVAWGTELDSHSGRAGAPLLKLKQLSSLLARVCKLKVVSKKLLQGVTGLLVHPFMHRRSMMCLLQDTFIWIENLEDGDRKPMPISVREELLSCGLMLPLCHSNVRWPISSRLGASDASLSMGGRAATIVTPGVSQTLYRFAEHKGEHVRLDWEKGAVQPPSSMRPAPRELELLISDLPWNQTETCSFGHKQHINILELKMILRELQDLVHQGSDPLRCVLLVDSRAAAGAWSKGRSSSKNLNRILRRALGWTLLGRKTLHLVWVRSECNPADYPSRGKRIPEPTGPPNELSKEIFGKSLTTLGPAGRTAISGGKSANSNPTLGIQSVLNLTDLAPVPKTYGNRSVRWGRSNTPLQRGGPFVRFLRARDI